MKLLITINTDNASFDDNFITELTYVVNQIPQIITEATYVTRKLKDSHGNIVGTVTPEEKE